MFIRYRLAAFCSHLIMLLSPGQTALNGLITAKKRQKVVSRKTADVVRVEDELQPRCRRGRTWGKIGAASDADNVLNCSKL